MARPRSVSFLEPQSTAQSSSSASSPPPPAQLQPPPPQNLPRGPTMRLQPPLSHTAQSAHSGTTFFPRRSATFLTPVPNDTEAAASKNDSDKPPRRRLHRPRSHPTFRTSSGSPASTSTSVSISTSAPAAPTAPGRAGLPPSHPAHALPPAAAPIPRLRRASTALQLKRPSQAPKRAVQAPAPAPPAQEAAQECCGMCGSCGRYPPWAPERLAKMSEGERRRVRRELKEMVERGRLERKMREASLEQGRRREKERVEREVGEAFAEQKLESASEAESESGSGKGWRDGVKKKSERAIMDGREREVRMGKEDLKEKNESGDQSFESAKEESESALGSGIEGESQNDSDATTSVIDSSDVGGSNASGSDASGSDGERETESETESNRGSKEGPDIVKRLDNPLEQDSDKEPVSRGSECATPELEEQRSSPVPTVSAIDTRLDGGSGEFVSLNSEEPDQRRRGRGGGRFVSDPAGRSLKSPAAEGSGDGCEACEVLEDKVKDLEEQLQMLKEVIDTAGKSTQVNSEKKNKGWKMKMLGAYYGSGSGNTEKTRLKQEVEALRSGTDLLFNKIHGANC